ncbi:MAG: hypothetical protein ACLS3M_08415 [Collinsella sp.]
MRTYSRCRVEESYFTDASAEDRKWNAGDMTNIAIGQGDIW